MDTQTFKCFFDNKKLALKEFNEAKPTIEFLYKSKIRFIDMYKTKGFFAKGWTVKYKLEGIK